MVSKNNRYLNQQKSGRKFEKYSIKKLKVGAASVLVGAGFFFGYHVEASEVTKTESVVNANNEALGDKKINTQATVESIPNKENSVTEQPVVTGVVEEKKVETTISQAAGIQAVQTLQTTELQEKLSALQTEINRIRSNEQQKLQIEKAEKLVEEAKLLLSSNTAIQIELDAKAKEVSSLTNILKSIKAEAVSKESKNKDSRNGKKMEEGTGFRAGEEAATSTTTTTGIAADVVDSTETLAGTRPPYTDKKVAEGLAKQIVWLDFADKKNWTNIDFENGEIYLKEGSIYEKEIIPDYIIKLKVKSLKPFQATEIYRKRMEANNATPEEKATFNPNATNGKINSNKRIRVMARYQNGYSEIAKVGVATPGKKTAIKGEEDSANIGIQFEVSGTYKGNVVRPVVIMADAESANPTESIVLTTNGSGWQLMMNLKKNRPDAESYRPFNMYTKDYLKFPDTPNTNDILHYHNIVTAGEGNKIAPKFLTSPDQVTGGLGSGVFGPGLTAGKYSVPVVMTKNATEVGMYVLAMGAQYAMMGVAPIDEGDAPASYGDATHTINTRDGLTGKEVKQPYIGSERPDADAINRKDWHGDDDTVVADEGINQLLPDSLKGSEGNIIKANISNAGYYTLNIQAHTGGAEKAYVRSWLDFNNNGQFDPDEASDIAEITQDGDVKLHFTNKTQKDAEGLLAAGTRVRIATSREEIENPTGTVFSGEVEDFKAKITHPPKGDKQTTIGEMKETQRTTVHFTPEGKNVYTQDDVNAEIDTTVAPVYINNKNGEKITLSDDNTYTVIGEGTYKFTPNGRDVNVEFTPADGFIGKANGITIRRQDTNKTTTDWGTPDATTLPNVNDVLNTMDGLYIPEVVRPTVEPTVNVNNAESRNLQGLPQKGQPTFNVESAKAPVTASAKLVDPRTNAVTELTTVDALENGTTNKIGTYTIVPETGEVTFTPNKDFKGIPAPATISADVELTRDKDGNITKKTLTATYTPTIISVAPTAEASRTSGVLGKPQTSPIVLDTEETGNDKGKTVNFNKGPEKGPKEERVELNPDTLTLLDGETEVTSVTTTDGKYELDKANKTITFTPNATFTGEAKPVHVRIKDMNGTKVDTTYTPTVTDVTIEGTPKETEAPQGQTQTGTPEFTVSSPDVRITGYKLINPTTNTPVDDEEIDVPNQGTYRIDKTTGTVKFIPKAEFTGSADGINVQAVTDVGKTHEAKYTPTVNSFVINAISKESKNIQGVPQEGTPTFSIPEDATNASITSRKLVDPTDNTPKNSVTVEGKGTFVIDETGKVTFTPVPSYTGEVPAIEVKATVTVTNEKNETARITQTATYKPEIVPLELGKTPATSTNLQGLEQKGTPIFTPKTIEVDEEPKTVSIEPGSYKLVKDNVEVAETTIPAYKKNTTEQIGTYTLNPSTGEVTFAPTDKTYAGEVEPVAVQVTGSNGVKVKTSYTPTIIPVTPSATEATTTKLQGATQETPVTFTPGKATIGTEEKTVPMDPNAYKLLGGQEGKTPLDTVPAMSEDGTKEVGTYTIKVIDGQPVVTFTPNDKAYAGKLKPVTVQGKDTNGTEATATYTPVITPIVPTSENGTSSGPQGVEQTGRVTFNPGKEPVTENTPVEIDKSKMTLLGTDGTTPVESLEVSKDGKVIGTYTLVKDPNGVPTGEVKFTPTDKSYVGEVPPATVQVKDANGTPAKATYTPTFTEVNPTSKSSETTGVQGQPQTSRVVLNQKDETDNTTVNFDKGDEKVDVVESTLTLVSATGEKATRVTVDNEGTYELNNGVITFTPLPTFHGKASGVSVQVEDANGKVVKNTYTPTVTEVTPQGTNAGSEGIQGVPQSGTPTFTSGHESVTMTISETNPAKLVVDGQPVADTTIPAKNTEGQQVGTYTIEPATGKVTFTPNPGFTGTPVPATVEAKNSNGTPATATYTPVVKAAVPSGDSQVSSGIQGVPQSATPVFTPGKNTVNNQEVSVPFEATSKAKLIDPSKTGEEAEVTTLVVENQGTYTIDDNGVVTFTPLPTFKGEATEVSIVRKDKNGTPATAKYKPTVVGVTPSATEATTTKLQGATQETPVTFTPGKATIGTEEKTVPMDPNAYKLLGGENGTTPLDTVPVMSEDGTKEVGTYTIKVVDGQPVVTFTPTDKTYAGKLKPVTVQGKDTNGTEVTTTYTPVITPIVPTSENGTSEGPQGVEQTGRVTFNPGKEPGTENTPVEIDKSKITLLGTDGTTPVESLTVSKDGKEIGTYTLVKDPSGLPTGEVKFTPTDKSYVGEVPPATVQVKDANGTPTTATYTPTFTEVNPTSKPSETTGFQGLPQISRVVLDEKDEADNTTVNFDKGNDKVALVPSTLTLVNADGAKVTSVTVPNEGTYELNNGVITFTPLPTFHGKASGVSVQAEDVNGKVAKTTYTPTVTEVRPVGTDAGSEGIQGAPQSGTPSFKSGNENIPMTVSATNPAKLVDPTTNQPIEATEIDAKNTAGEKVGKYTINPATGEVTFTPDPGFSGTPVPATVQAKDGNGTPATATYIPVVKAAVPSGDNQVTSDIQGAKQTVTPVFTPGKNTVNGQDVSVPFEPKSKAKLIDPSKTGEEAEVTSLEVPNQGTYTIDDNGVVTFTPLPTFKGEATEVSIVRKDKNGTPATAKYKPTVVGVTPSATEATTTKLQGATQETSVTFTPGKATIGTAEKSVPMDPTAYKLLGGENGTTPLDTVPAMSEDGIKEVGTYTIKIVDGQPVVTFTPTDKAYAGKLKPVTVQGKDTNGTEATTTYTPVITPIVPTAENGTSSGPQGVEQIGRVTFNPGKEPGTENTPVEIDKSKITLLGTDGTTPVESLTVSKDGKEIGTYTLVKDPSGLPTGEVKFTPTDKSYVGEVPPATVQVKDANGTPTTATYTPTLTKVTPTGKDITTTGLQGKVQTGTPTFTPGTPEVPMDDESPATFEDGNNTKTIDKVGTFTVAKDGTVTFTPDKAFSGEAPEITVKRVDKNGTTVTAKYRAIVAKVLPIGEGSETEGTKGKSQTSVVVFDKKDEDKSTVNFNKGDKTVVLNPSTLTLVDKNRNPSTEVKVPGEGTYILVNNVITFTPEKDFAGKATGVTVQIKDINGTPLEKTYTPTVRPVTTFVDPAGNLITVDKNNKPVEGEVDGSKQPMKDIYGYKFVRTETDNKGNTKHIYEQAEGKSVKVTYVLTTGETLSDSQTVETKDKFIGTDYDASIEALKLERIEKDGKVYLLKERKTDSAAENGKLSDQEQTVTYVYEAVQEPASNQKYGNVVVVYKDKFGRPISGTTDSGKEVSSTVIDTPNSPLTTKYDTTDHKPQTITTKDGKKYKLVKVLKTSDAEKSGVKARTSVITYVYEMLDNTTEYPEAHIGLVLVNYLDVEGNPISGKTPEGKVVPNMVVDTEAELVGKDYDTTDHKVSTIIVENGDVFELLKVSETSVEKGKLKEGTTNVDYIYHKVVTKFVDENGKEIQSPEKGRTDKKDIPEYTFKETKKDENGNTVHVYTKKSSSTPVTPTPSTPENGSLTIWKDGDGNNIKSPEHGKKEHSTIDGYIYERSEVDKDGNTVHIYRKVSSETPVVNEKETLFVDGNGKPLQPAKKGQHPHETIPGYEFVRTETDANGNVRHVYRAIAQSQETVNPSPTVEQRKNELPNTGTGDEFVIFGAAAASILAGLGIAIPGKKKEEEK